MQEIDVCVCVCVCVCVWEYLYVLSSVKHFINITDRFLIVDFLFSYHLPKIYQKVLKHLFSNI